MLSAEDEDSLRAKARESGTSPEDLAARIILAWLNERRTFEEAAKHSFEKNAELYRQLAEGPK
jgi:hypothetical protein